MYPFTLIDTKSMANVTQNFEYLQFVYNFTLNLSKNRYQGKIP